MPDRDAELWGEDNRMPTHARVRAFLENVAKRQIPITYQELTKALQILPPHSIHRVTEALERLMEEDAAADRPFIAALAISKAIALNQSFFPRLALHKILKIEILRKSP